MAAEGAGDALSLITWVAFGSLIVALVFAQITWQAVVYGLLSLTLAHMVPVAIAVWGLKPNLYTVLFYLLGGLAPKDWRALSLR